MSRLIRGVRECNKKNSLNMRGHGHSEQGFTTGPTALSCFACSPPLSNSGLPTFYQIPSAMCDTDDFKQQSSL